MTAIAIRAMSRAGKRTADERTVDDVFAALGPAVHGYVRSGGAEDSEDVLSEVFVRVARGLGRFSGGDDDLRRWVFTIAHNCLMDEHRRRSRQRFFMRDRANREPTTPAPNEPFDETLHNALLQLTPEQREVVTLRFVADLAIEEVARVTGRPTGAVKSLQHRALRVLAAALTTDTLLGEPVPRGSNE